MKLLPTDGCQLPTYSVTRISSRITHHGLLWLAAILAAFVSVTASAQYPTKPLRLLVAFPPGGGPDIVARLLAAKLTDALGQQVVVDNRTGANGNIAGEALVKSSADGYTLLVGQDSLLTINPHLYRKMPFNPLRDFTPVASLVSNGFVLAVNPAVPAATLPEFVEFARRASPPLQYASGGNGSQHHFTMERLKARAGFQAVHVPYKGGAPATTATVSGEVMAMMSGTSTAPQIRAGRLRALAVTSLRRSTVLPEVPTIAEFYPGFEMTQWYGLFAPVGVPEPVLARLRAETGKALASPDMKDKLKNAGGIEAWIGHARGVRQGHPRRPCKIREAGARDRRQARLEAKRKAEEGPGRRQYP